MLNSIESEKKLKFLYVCIFLVEIPLGIFMLVAPSVFINLLGFPKNQDPIMYGVAASVWLAFGLLSLLSFRNPGKFVPILLFQFTYKMIWFVGVILPLVITGQLQMYGILVAATFGFYVILDIFIIPWDTILEKD